MKLQIQDVQRNEELKTYFNWTANALLPIFPGAADRFFKIHRETIIKMADELIRPLNYLPGIIYRGVVLREPVNCIMPKKLMRYLSFSTDISIARHFADVNGFGSDIINVAQQLGTYGYIIEHTPQAREILFHYSLLDILPYSEAFNLMGMDGEKEVEGLRKQKEIMIEQPAEPFLDIKPFSNEIATMPIRRSEAR